MRRIVLAFESEVKPLLPWFLESRLRESLNQGLSKSFLHKTTLGFLVAPVVFTLVPTSASMTNLGVSFSCKQPSAALMHNILLLKS